MSEQLYAGKDVPNINEMVAPAVQALVDNARALRLGVSQLANGTTVVDAGINHRGGLEAGRLIGEICLGGLGRVALRTRLAFSNWPWQVAVSSLEPVIACLGSQYAGWSLQQGEGKAAFFALGSGPARAMGSKEALFNELGYRAPFGKACLVLETDKFPPVEIAEKVARYCQIPGKDLTLILTPTSSLAGCVQIVARVLETAIHKAHILGFPLEAIIDGLATAPVPPPAPDFLVAMGRTNDALLFGGEVQLYVDAEDAAAEDLALRMPSNTSSDFGRPFAEVFKAVSFDFYKIDPMLFSPARIIVTSLRTGRTFVGGHMHPDLLDQSFAKV
jgi:methenyltetrahydromethanopterin cyclohydrolase